MDRGSLDPSRVIDAMAQAARATPGLDLLMLFGSRARGDIHPGSDWDLGYLATNAPDVDAWLGTFVELAGSDRVDLVDLASASGLLRYRVARDGRLVYEARPGLGERFCLDAAQFWCDAAPVLQRGYAQVLAELEP